MGFRYRKSVNFGPLRINFSKSGVGYSIGGKGYRYTKKANGGTRQTWSIPGTGISYVEDKPAKKKEAAKTKPTAIRSASTYSASTVSQVTSRSALANQVSASRNSAPRICPICGAELTLTDTICPVCSEPLTATTNGISEQKTYIGCSSGGKYANKKPEKKKSSILKRIGQIWLTCAALSLTLGMCSTLTADPEETQPSEPIATTLPFTQAIETEVHTDPTVIPTELPTTAPTEIQTEAPTETPSTAPTESAVIPPIIETPHKPQEQERTYVLNTNTRKFHYPSCSSADDIKPSNRSEYTGTRSEVIAKGYSPCGRCDP